LSLAAFQAREKRKQPVGLKAALKESVQGGNQ
jgi:hypothetical protein